MTTKCIAVHIPESLITLRVGKHSSSNTISHEQLELNYRKANEKLQKRFAQQ